MSELARDATAALNRALGGDLSDPLTLIALPALFLETIDSAAVQAVGCSPAEF